MCSYVPHERVIDWIYGQKNVPKWSIRGQSVPGGVKNKVRSTLLIAVTVGLRHTCHWRILIVDKKC